MPDEKIDTTQKEIDVGVALNNAHIHNVNQIALRMYEPGSIYRMELDEIADKQNQIVIR